MIQFAQAELPLNIRADQAKIQLLQAQKTNDFVGALPWLDKAITLDSLGYKLSPALYVFAAQVYFKNDLKTKAIPWLTLALADENQANFWNLVLMDADINPSGTQIFLEKYLSKEKPAYYQIALELYTKLERDANNRKDSIQAEQKRILQEQLRAQAIQDSIQQEKERVAEIIRLHYGESYPQMASMTDGRDGKVYKTIRIGSQTWMVDNLNFQNTDSWCYDNKDSNCQKCGRLYNWNAARSACPKGWHLPSDREFRILDNTDDNLGGVLLKSAAINGNNASGFSALACGQRHKSGTFLEKDHYAYFWSATEKNVDAALYRMLLLASTEFASNLNYRNFAYSVRCVKN